MTTLSLFATVLVAAAFVTTAPAHAGRSCEQRLPSMDTVRQGMTLAERTAARLEASGARVALVARVGQDLSRHGLRYSHLGIAYRDDRGTQPVWRVVHKLNECGSARSSVYRHGLGQFFLDDLHAYESAIVALAPEAQQAVLDVLLHPQRAVSMHERAYSMVAYPWAVRYQQSNQWAIETLAYALGPGVRTREQAQAWLRLRNYQPTVLRLSPLTRLGGRMTRANIAFDDHPGAERFSDRIATVTVDSVFDWLERTGLGQRRELVR